MSPILILYRLYAPNLYRKRYRVKGGRQDSGIDCELRVSLERNFPWKKAEMVANSSNCNQPFHDNLYHNTYNSRPSSNFENRLSVCITTSASLLCPAHQVRALHKVTAWLRNRKSGGKLRRRNPPTQLCWLTSPIDTMWSLRIRDHKGKKSVS